MFEMYVGNHKFSVCHKYEVLNPDTGTIYFVCRGYLGLSLRNWLRWDLNLQPYT